MDKYRDMSDAELSASFHETRLACVEHTLACQEMTERHDIVRARIARLLGKDGE
jgi:hypothetical protein